MIRPLTLLSIVAAAGAGLHVYNTKHAVFMLDRELRTVAQGIQEAETRTQALQAEWAWATEQERLRGLAQRHLALEPMQPAQFVRFAEADRRLPPPEAHGGPVALFAPGQPAATENRMRIALLAPEPATGRAAPVAAPPIAPAPMLTAVAQAALAAAAALPLPAPAAPEPPPAVRAAAALPPLPPVVRAAAAEPRPAEARASEPRPAAADVAARAAATARSAPPPPAPPPQRSVFAPPRPAPEPATSPLPAAAPRPQSPAPVAVAAAAPPRPLAPVAAPLAAPPRPLAPVAVASVAPRAPEAAAASLGSFGAALGGVGSALGSARAALPPPVAFGSVAAGASFR